MGTILPAESEITPIKTLNLIIKSGLCKKSILSLFTWKLYTFSCQNNQITLECKFITQTKTNFYYFVYNRTVGSLSGVSVLNVVLGCNMLININSGKINNMGPNFTSL
jgi:hypothetical protein